MVKIGLQIKAFLENVSDLEADGEDFRWYLKFKCANCGEISDKFQYITRLDKQPLKANIIYTSWEIMNYVKLSILQPLLTSTNCY